MTNTHRPLPRVHCLAATLWLLTLLTLLTGCTPIRQARVVDLPPQPTAPPATESIPAEAPAEAATQSLADTLATAPLEAEIPTTPEILSGQFDNGLQYFIRPNHKPEGRVELRLVVNAGSVLEDEDQRGLAHFVEHMAFNGTRNFEKQELVDYLEKIGTRFGADLNAYTSFDETVYQLKLPTDDPQIVETGFQILEDWAHGITFDPEEIEKERGVITEEWRLGLGAGARLRDQQFPVIFQGARYAERLPIGLPEVIEEAPPEALTRFYRDWYRPDLMAVVVVGDLPVERAEALVKKHFAHIPAAEDPRPRESFPVPEHEETLFSLATDPELASTSLAVLYKHPTSPEGTFGAYRSSLVEGLYHGMLNARLEELVQQGEPPFLFAYSSQGSFVRSSSIFSQQARVREGEVARGLAALLTEVERIERHGFTASELERAKVSLRRSYEQAYRERDKLQSSSLIAELVRHYLQGESVPGIEAELGLIDRFLPEITLDEVNHLAREWITEENRVITVSAPEKEGLTLPSEAELLAVFEQVEAREIAAYVDQQRDEPLLAKVPRPGPVVEERVFPDLGVTDWKLANGIRVVLKPTDFQNDQVALTGFSPGGHSLVADADHTSAVFATAILGESGLGEFSQIELGKALAGKVAGAQVAIGELEEGVSAFASPQDLETMFQLLYLRFTAPRLDPEAFQSLMSRLRILIQNRDSQPSTVFADRMNEVLSQGHPRRRPISDELIAEIDPQAALRIYQERFADASDFTFVLVGNFEPDSLRPLVETYLGGLPGNGREEIWKDVGIRRPASVEKVRVRKGLEPRSQVSLIFHGPASWSREGLHEIASLARVLQIRLREVLREDLGATYGVSVNGSLSQRPRQEYTFTISFGCSPAEVEGLVETVFQELDDVAEHGIDPANLEKVKESQRRKRETDLLENSFWLRALESYYTFGFDLDLLMRHEELLATVTPEGLQAAARRYFDKERYVLGVLDPEGDAEIQPAP